MNEVVLNSCGQCCVDTTSVRSKKMARRALENRGKCRTDNLVSSPLNTSTRSWEERKGHRGKFGKKMR